MSDILFFFKKNQLPNTFAFFKSHAFYLVLTRAQFSTCGFRLAFLQAALVTKLVCSNSMHYLSKY